MRALRIAVVVLVACGDDPATSSETGTNTSTTTAAAPTSATAETSDITTSSTAATTGDEVDPLAEYQPCGVGCGADQCITLDGASICGPGCFHFGPDRCDYSSSLREFCPYDEAGVPGICILGCATNEDCPARGMVCLPCEPPFATACQVLNNFLGFEGSESMCAWPNP